MRLARSIPLMAVACALALASLDSAQAQWGMASLPQTDFTWVWGNRARAEAGRGADISMTGTDAGFQCELTARLRPGSRLSRMEVRQIENDLRTSLSFIESTAYMMNALDQRRDIDWAVLDCEEMARRDGGSAQESGPQSVTAWVELEVRVYEEFPAPAGEDGGHWTASYTQAGAWRLRRSGSGRRASYTVRSEGLLLPAALQNVDGSAYAVCHDGSGEVWRTEWEPPVEAEPVTLSSANEGGELVLWTSVPDVWMQHPGHEHIASGSECRTVEEPFRDRFSLAYAPLEAAGAEVDDGGAFRLVELSWPEIADAARGGPEVAFAMSHEASGVAFEVRGSIGERPD